MKKALISLLFLSGCMVGPNYRRPCIQMPPCYHFLPSDAEVCVSSLWWTQFQDPTLTTLIEQALRYNDDVRIAAANIERSMGALMRTRSTLFPQLGYSFSGQREKLSSVTNPLLQRFIRNPSTTYEALATATWDIDLWGRIRRQVEAAQHDLFATVQARRNVILSLVASVANTYLLLRGLDEQLVIAKKTQGVYAESLEYFEKQFAYGQTSKMTVAQAATQYDTATAVIPVLELQIVQTENALSILLGSNPGEIPRGKSIAQLSLPQVPASLPSSILLDRPDIAESEERLMAANARIGAARALYFPDISLTGAYGNQSHDLSNLFTGPSNVWNYAGNAIGPIFTFGKIQGTNVEAEAEREAALYEYKLNIKTAFAEVEDSLAAKEYYQKQMAAQRNLVEAAQEYTDLASLQYDAGYSPYFVVLQAQEQLFPAELQLVQTRVDLLNSFVSIYQALGGSWVDSADCLSR